MVAELCPGLALGPGFECESEMCRGIIFHGNSPAAWQGTATRSRKSPVSLDMLDRTKIKTRFGEGRGCLPGAHPRSSRALLTRGGFQKLFPSRLTWQVMRNEELTQELLSLAKESIHSPGSAQQSSPELGRGRAAGHPCSARRGKVRDSLPFHQPLGEQGSTRPLLLSLPKPARRCSCL